MLTLCTYMRADNNRNLNCFASKEVDVSQTCRFNINSKLLPSHCFRNEHHLPFVTFIKCKDYGQNLDNLNEQWLLLTDPYSLQPSVTVNVKFKCAIDLVTAFTVPNGHNSSISVLEWCTMKSPTADTAYRRTLGHIGFGTQPPWHQHIV